MQIPISNNALFGRPVADEILTKTKAAVEKLSAIGWPAKLVSITIGDVAAVNLYVRNQAKAAEKASIQFEQRE